MQTADKHGATVEPFIKTLTEEFDSIQGSCHLIFVEFPEQIDAVEIIRARQWCLANPSHILIAVFQSADLFDANIQSMDFIEDYVFANSSPQQILMRFWFALNAQKRRQHKVEQIRQSISVDELMQSDYGSILGSLAEGVVYQGPSDEVLYANDAACEFLGLSRDQLMGKTSYDPRWAALKEDGTPFMPGEHPSAITLRTGEPMSDVFMSIQQASGDMRQVTINTQPLFASKSDKAMGVIVSFREITGVVQARKERDEIRDQLLQSQKMEALGTLAGGIAHDFNNLLTPILGLAQKLKFGLGSGDLHQQLSVIESNALSARDLINQILTFSRKKPDLMVRVNLSEVVQSVSGMVDEFADDSIAKSFELEDQLFVDGDGNQLAQLFMNLMTNAIKAVKDSEVKTIKVKAWRDPDALHLPIKVSIEDTGVGIAESLLDRIYEPFFTTSDPGKGTGLGLSVAHNVVKAYGGNIDCKSTEGEGTCFTLAFADSQLVSEAAVHREPEPISEKLSGCALILDDNLESCSVLAELVQFFGMTTLEFNSPLAAVEAVRNGESKIDIIISDFSMPQMNGFEFAGAIRSLGHNIPIAIITGYGEDLFDKNKDKEKCDMVLAKPIQLAELESALRKLMAKRG